MTQQIFRYKLSAEKLRLCLSRRGLSVTELGKLAGLTGTQINAIMGGANVTARTLERLANSLQFHPGKFFEREVVKNGK